MVARLPLCSYDTHKHFLEQIINMNNFTKEELMNILYSLEHLYEPTFDLSKIYLLRNKVESMIDNYCEHDDSGGEVDIFVYTCSNCNAFLLR